MVDGVRGRRRLPARVRALVSCCHPEPVLTVTALTAVATSARGRRSEAMRASAAVLAGHLYVGWSNDYLDRHLDADAHRDDKPLTRGEVNPRAIAMAACAALAAAIPLSAACGRRAAVRHLAGLGAASAYNAGLKRTPVSWIPYAAGFSQVPAFVLLSTSPRRAAPRWAAVSAALLGTGAHFAQSLRDAETDRQLGTGGLPARIGATPSGIVAGLLMGGGVAVAAARRGDGGGEAPTARFVRRASTAGAILLSAGVAGTAVLGRHGLAFRLAMASALATVPAFLTNVAHGG